MDPRQVVSIKSAASIVAYAASRGLRPELLLAEAQISPAAAADPDARVTHAQMLRLWSECVARTGDPHFGLHMAEWLQPEEYHDVLGYACRSSPTLGESYRRAARYFALVHQQVRLSLVEEGAEARLRLDADIQDAGPPPPHPMECVLTTLLLLARRSLAREVQPLGVRFCHAGPADPSEHARVFGVRVRFSAPANELVLPRALLGEPLRHGDARLAALLDRQAEAQLAQLPAPGGGPLDRAEAAVRAALQAGEPTLEGIAAQLHMSPRSLQRHLQERGTSFRGVVDGVRRDLALRHLSEGRLALSEIAFLLGFAEVSAFHRAFRRWTGRTPASYRGA